MPPPGPPPPPAAPISVGVEGGGARPSGIEILKKAFRETPERGRRRTAAAREVAAEARDATVSLLNQTGHLVSEGVNLLMGLPTMEYPEGVVALVANAGSAAGKELDKVREDLAKQGRLLINGASADLRAIRDAAIANIVEPTADEARRIGKAWDKGKWPLMVGGTAIGTAGIWMPRLAEAIAGKAAPGVTQAAQKLAEGVAPVAPTVEKAGEAVTKIPPEVTTAIPQMIEATAKTLGPQLAQGFVDYGPAALLATAGLGAGYVGYRLARRYGPEVAALAGEKILEPIKTAAAEQALRFYEEHRDQIDYIRSLPPAARKAALEKWEKGKAAGKRLTRYADARAKDFADGLDRAAAGTAALYYDVSSLAPDVEAGIYSSTAGGVRLAREARAYAGTPLIKAGEVIVGIPQREIGRNEAMTVFSQTLDQSAVAARQEAARRRGLAMQWKMRAGLVK